MAHNRRKHKKDKKRKPTRRTASARDPLLEMYRGTGRPKGEWKIDESDPLVALFNRESARNNTSHKPRRRMDYYTGASAESIERYLEAPKKWLTREYGDNDAGRWAGKPLCGRTVQVGDVEKHGRCEIRIVRRGGNVVAMLCTDSGDYAGLSLAYTTTADCVDESRLIKYGRSMGARSAWNDNEPDVVELITLDRLRQYARSR